MPIFFRSIISAVLATISQKLSTVQLVLSLKWWGYKDKPNIPPLSLKAFKRSLDLFHFAACQNNGFACVIAIGFSLNSIASNVLFSAE